MDGHREIDASLDREIESLLAAEPSAEFVARVRTRVAQEPDPHQWRTTWMLTVAGAVTVVIVTVIAWPSRETAGPKGPAPRVQEQPIVARATESVAVPPPVQGVRRQPAVTRVVALAESPARALDIDLPEVVLGENEVKAYTALVASIRQSRFDVAVPAAPDLDAPLEIKEQPPIEPIEIEPIVRLAVLQAEGERP